MKFFLFFFVIISILSFKCVENLITREQFPNYLEINSINLDHHFISKENTKGKSLIILGSSSVAGSNIPPASTLADYLNNIQKDFVAFNLAKNESTSLEALLFLKLAMEKKQPKVVLMGLGPDMFNGTLSGIAVASNMNKLEVDLPVETVEIMNKEIKKKYFIKQWIKYTSSIRPPLELLIKIKSAIYNYKVDFFGQTLSKNPTEQEISVTKTRDTSKIKYVFMDAIINICRKNNITLIVYLVPYLSVEQHSNKINWENNQKDLEIYLRKHQVTFFDYTNVLPPTPEYFLDYTHLKPKGYETIALQFWNDYQQSIRPSGAR